MEEYRFVVDTVRKQLVRKNRFKLSCQERKIPQIIIIERNMEEGDTMLLVDTAFYYTNYA